MSCSIFQLFSTFRIPFLVLAVAAMSSCGNKPAGEPDWLVGNWKMPMNGSWYYESWKKTADGNFTGKAYILYKKDTTFSEQMRMYYENKRWNYKRSVNGMPVTVFLADLESEVSDSVVFRNPGAEFPQTIVYIKALPGLKERIEGTDKGTDIYFPMEMEEVK